MPFGRRYKASFSRSFGERTVAVLVLLGYLFVLNSSATGHGWHLLVHQIQEHHMGAPVLAAPEVYVEGSQDAALAMSTLRNLHRHDSAQTPHSHGAKGDRHHDAAMLPNFRRVVRAHVAPLPEHCEDPQQREDGFHEHDGYVHTHDLPEPDATFVVVLALDQHHLPSAPALPIPLASPDADLDGPVVALRSIDLLVETPPPIALG